LLAPFLLLAWATSALGQSAANAHTAVVKRSTFWEPGLYSLLDQGDWSANESTWGMLSVNGPGDGNGSNSAGTGVHSGNPAATDVQVGNGQLGDWLGVNENGFRLGGISILDVNAQPTGGDEPGSWTSNSLTILDMSLDMEEWMNCEGGKLGVEFLFYSGGDTNGDSGSVMGYNSLDAGPPRTRFEIYTLWYRQNLLDEMVSVRIGKLVPTFDFNNVVRSVPFAEDAYNIPAVSSALLTPLYLSPTQLGIMPGYYNSATGMVTVLKPNDHLYAEYGIYDGNLAAGRQTGLEGPHFNGYYLQVAECGGDWTIGQQEKPGALGAGYWKQTGLLSAPGGNVHGAEGVYLFGSQRLYFERPGESNNGLTAWIQLAATDSDFISTHRYLGSGISYFGPLRYRDNDSAGFAFAYGKMNDDPATDLGPQESIYTWYYQYQANPSCYLQPNVTYISTPASRPGLSDVFALTFRAIVVF
jgi:porin